MPPAPTPFPSPNANAVFPALYLYPLNDTWAPKHISLSNVHTKIGRQTSSKTAPGERNGFFDSKVLSRQHAEVWEENGKIFIKDVKSSNGTFINGERLSNEGHESEPFELKSDDIVEFGIDIVGEDNKTIIHHKVAARVVCVFSEQDAQVAARAEQHQQQQHLQQQQQQFMQQQQAASSPNSAQAGPSAANAPQNFPFAAQRRAQLAQQGLGGMGGMRPPGKPGLSFDVILSRLQGELQKSRETNAELNSLTGAMSEIHDTLGGNVPVNLPHFPARLPPVRPPQEAPHSTSVSPEQLSTSPNPGVSAAAVLDLQSQLRDTQSSLASHLDKVKALEGVLADQEVMKQEVKTLREMMEERRRGMEQDHEQEPRGGFDPEEDDEDEDDAKSIATIMPHELESVEEEDEDQLAEEERRDQERHEEDTAQKIEEEMQTEAEAEAEEREQRRLDLGLGRPRTPEPSRIDGFLPSTLLGVPRRASMSSPLSQVPLSEAGSASPDDVYEQISMLSKRVTTVMAFTTTLEAQQTMIQALESRVESLETMLKAAEEALARSSASAGSASSELSMEEHNPEVKERESLTDLMTEWKKSVEGQWSSVQEEWTQDRERLNKAREEWEAKSRQLDTNLEKMTSLQSTVTAYQQQQVQLQVQFQQHQQQLQQRTSALLMNGDAVKHNGLVTPPSPRSQSSDSGRYRRSRRRRRSTGSRERSRSRSREGDEERAELDAFAEADVDTDTTLASDEGGSSRVVAGIQVHSMECSLPTPESSVRASVGSLPPDPLSIIIDEADKGRADGATATMSPTSMSTSCAMSHGRGININVQTAMGVLVLSVAAAAVIWKVKPE